MTNFEKIKALSLEDFASFLDNITCDEVAWDSWFNKNYCDKCPPVEVDGHEYTPCEYYSNPKDSHLACREISHYFTEDIILAWLREEVAE